MHLEIWTGIVGFFTFMAAVQTIAATVRGHNAVRESLVTLVFALVLYFLIQKRHSLKR